MYHCDRRACAAALSERIQPGLNSFQNSLELLSHLGVVHMRELRNLVVENVEHFRL